MTPLEPRVTSLSRYGVRAASLPVFPFRTTCARSASPSSNRTTMGYTSATLLRTVEHARNAGGDERAPVAAAAQRRAHVRARDLLLGSFVQHDHLVPCLAQAVELRAAPVREEPDVLRHVDGDVCSPELRLVHRE